LFSFVRHTPLANGIDAKKHRRSGKIASIRHSDEKLQLKQLR
jgi:hypothetical protein